jgi:putative MATE family efflux protein
MNKSPKHLWEEKIWKLLAKQSAPAVVWMLVMALYNFVDTVFVGRGVWTDAIAAVSVVMPIQMIIWAFAMAFGIGSASIISRKLGENDYEEVSKTFWTFQSSNLLFSIVLSILWFIFARPLLTFFGAIPGILEAWYEYLSILLVWVVFFCFNMWNNNIIRSVGHAKSSMIIMLSSAISNVILDWLFIFKFKMWIAGAARATVLSWIIGTIMVLIYYFGKNNIIKAKISDFKIKFKKLKEILSIWISSLARQSAASVTTILVNNLLWIYGWSLAIAAYGIINRAVTVFFMPMFGVIQWMQPIIWYNHGAWFKQRVKKVTILAVKVLTIFTTIVFAINITMPWILLNIFSKDVELIALAVPAMRLMVLMFPIIWFQVVASGFYQSLWRAKEAFWFAIIRQVVILIPILMILPKFFGLNGIRYSFPLSDFLAAVIIFVVFYKDLKKCWA